MDIVRKLVEDRPDFSACQPTGAEKAYWINDFIFCSPGLSNVYLIKTEAGRILINAGMGFEAPLHKLVLDSACPGPTPFLILTQGHVDHVGGVRQLRDPGTQVVAQRNNAACQADDKRISGVRLKQASVWFGASIDAMAKTMKQSGDVVQDVPSPDILLDDFLAIEHGGIRFELISVPGGETIDSVAVWLPDHRIVFTGNMFGPLFPHFPNFNTIRGDRYRYVEPYLASLRRVRALEPKILITGHFAPIVGEDLIRACLDRLEAAVEHMHSATLAGMNAGQDIWTLMREVTLPDALYVGQGYGKVSWGVRTVWETYMGWFKSQRTSELYPTQPHEIFADLVALAGIDAVVARGHERLSAGEAEAAQLIAEAALAQNPNDGGAQRLSLLTHRALLDRSAGENFWEAGWLNTEIGKLEAPPKRR